jgi:outer membrane protein, heavy metal efflux system
MALNRRHPIRRVRAALLVAVLAAGPAQAAHEADVSDSTLTLPALERAVLEHNPSLAAVRASLAEAEARSRREGSLEDARAQAWVAPRSLGSDAVDPAWGISVEQPLPLFGQRGLARREARAERDAARGDLDTARLDLLRETRRAYYDDYHWWVVHQTTTDVLALMRSIRQSALARYASGSVGQQDVLQADVEIAMLEHEAVSAERNRHVVESRLRALLHLPPVQLLPPPSPSLAPPEPDRAHAILAARGRAPWPELEAAEARIEARRAQVDRAGRDRFPGTSLIAEYDRAMVEPEWRTRVGLAITLPFNPGRVAAGQDEARARLDRAIAERDAQRDQLERRLAEAATQLEESLHELGILRDQLVPSTERAVVAARAGYESGKGDFSALLGALRDHQRARLEYHRTIAAANDAAAELERAMGGPAEGAR